MYRNLLGGREAVQGPIVDLSIAVPIKVKCDYCHFLFLFCFVNGVISVKTAFLICSILREGNAIQSEKMVSNCHFFQGFVSSHLQGHYHF